MPTTENSDSSKAVNELEFLELQYQVLSDRRISHDTLLWNVPSLLFVAQAILWTLALDEAKNPIIRFFISILSIAIAYASYQLFERHRLMEIVDSQQLYSIEEYIRQKYHAINNLPVMTVHHKLSKRSLISGEHKMVTDFIKNHYYYKFHNKKYSLCQQESSSLWRTVFIIVLILSLIIFVYNIVVLIPFLSRL